MSYDISTHLIWRYFNGEYICPVCAIRQITERDVCELYLSEAVMEDAERDVVNKIGFCEKHYDVLYSGANKCGLALQMSTRLKKIISYTKPVSDVKSAEKMAKTLEEKLSTCIVCDKIKFHMDRYFKTIPKLYRDDEKFRRQARSLHGLCYKDYIALLKHTKYAGKYANDFITLISTKQLEHASSLKEQIDEFTKAFDYRSKFLPSPAASKSLKSVRIALYGDFPLPPVRK